MYSICIPPNMIYSGLPSTPKYSPNVVTNFPELRSCPPPPPKQPEPRRCIGCRFDIPTFPPPREFDVTYRGEGFKGICFGPPHNTTFLIRRGGHDYVASSKKTAAIRATSSDCYLAPSPNSPGSVGEKVHSPCGCAICSNANRRLARDHCAHASPQLDSYSAYLRAKFADQPTCRPF